MCDVQNLCFDAVNIAIGNFALQLNNLSQTFGTTISAAFPGDPTDANARTAAALAALNPLNIAINQAFNTLAVMGQCNSGCNGAAFAIQSLGLASAQAILAAASNPAIPTADLAAAFATIQTQLQSNINPILGSIRNQCFNPCDTRLCNPCGTSFVFPTTYTFSQVGPTFASPGCCPQPCPKKCSIPRYKKSRRVYCKVRC